MVFIHCLFVKKGNIPSQPVEGKGVKVTDITKEFDFTNVSTVKYVIKQIKGPVDIFFYCSPCTGGSTWQRLKLELARRNMLEQYHCETHRPLGPSLESLGKF